MKVGTGAYEPKMLRIMQAIGLILPDMLLVYGIGISMGIFDAAHYKGDVLMYILMTVWITFAIYSTYHPPNTPQKMAAHITIYHVFSLAYIYCVIGFSSPLITCWAVMYFISYIYFSYTGLLLSLLTLLLSWIVYISIYPINGAELTNQLTSILTGFLVGLFAIILSRLQEKDKSRLEYSKRRAIQQEQALSAVINSASQAIITISSTGKIRLYNSAFLGLVDTNKNLQNADINKVLRLVDEDDKPVSLFSIMKQQRHFERDDLSIKINADERMRLRIAVNDIQNSYGVAHVDEFVCTLRDITKEKSLEEERDEFISVVSHELRTPITIAEGTISNALMMFGREGVKQDKIQAGVRLAHDQVKFLASMVNDLSTLSRAERGVADASEDIDIKQLAQKLYVEYEPQAKQKGLRMDLDVHGNLGSVTTSRLYLEELLQNFITNAIKYTKEGTVTVTIKKQANSVVFDIKDSGIGISKSDQARIFEKFYRSEDYRTRETGGTGLGLYVAAKLARKIGTRIDIKSRLNHGSTFSITLPSSKK